MSADGESSRRSGPPLDGDLLLQLIRRPPKPQTARTPPSIPPPTHQNSNIPVSRRPIFSHHSPSPRSDYRNDRSHSRPRGDGVPSDSQKFSGSWTPKPNARTDGGLDIQRDFDRSHPHKGKGRNPGPRHEALPSFGTVGNGRGKPQGSIQRPVGQDLRTKEADRSAPNGNLQWRQKSTSHGSNGEVQGTRLVLTPQLDQSRDALGSNLREGFDGKEFIQDSQNESVEEEIISVVHKHVKNQVDALADQLTNSLSHKDDNDIVDKKVMKRNDRRVKGHRSDSNRGLQMLSRRIRIHRRGTQCRHDIEFLAPSFLSMYESLIPSVVEKDRQKQLLLSLRKLVSKEWPNAQLHLYGSCANSFGMSNSDIDICLAIEDSDLSKSEILLRLADILQLDNLQNVQAVTTARVPIVKMMDPITGISCDICVNNLLSVVNTKLLSDYARIDERLRQLAFIVKHWAKSRGVNETYRGTLSSYAYVLMCIHFLQLRNPAILPCLQQMKATYVMTVDDRECAYFDQVEELHHFGVRNNESIAQLLWSFFHYWAYKHDYMNDVISVRTGQLIRKQEKDWTKRIEFDRHLLCIEDPFDTSHDLGRVVDKFTIKILREEFERAAYILQYDPNPSVALFEPYEPRLSLVD